MNFRQRIQALLLLILILITFAAYQFNTGSTMYLQWLTVVVFLGFTFVFDLMFTNDKTFLFDPDADNWRRKTIEGQF
jgi:O-antigen ligase